MDFQTNDLRRRSCYSAGDDSARLLKSREIKTKISYSIIFDTYRSSIIYVAVLKSTTPKRKNDRAVLKSFSFFKTRHSTRNLISSRKCFSRWMEPWFFFALALSQLLKRRTINNSFPQTHIFRLTGCGHRTAFSLQIVDGGTAQFFDRTR